MYQPKRILLIRLSHLGDVVHALPAYHAVRAAWPRAEVAWVVQPEFAELVAGLTGVARVLRFDRDGGVRAWLRLHAELGAFGADLAIDAQGNLKSALAALASGAPRRVGLHRRDWRETIGAVACTERATPAAGGHAIDRMRALARHLAGDRRDAERFDPDVQPAELERGRELARELLDLAAAHRAIVQLSDPRDIRSWPAEHALALIDDLARAGWSVAVISGPGEAAVGRRVAAARPDSPAVRHWVAQRGLRELAGFFTAAAESQTRFVGPDSGPMHLAWACGLRVVSLAGPQSHLATGPWPVPDGAADAAGPHRVVRAAPQPPCAPCLSRSCTHAAGPVCMSELQPAAVLAALRSQS